MNAHNQMISQHVLSSKEEPASHAVKNQKVQPVVLVEPHEDALYPWVSWKTRISYPLNKYSSQVASPKPALYGSVAALMKIRQLVMWWSLLRIVQSMVQNRWLMWALLLLYRRTEAQSPRRSERVYPLVVTRHQQQSPMQCLSLVYLRGQARVRSVQPLFQNPWLPCLRLLHPPKLAKPSKPLSPLPSPRGAEPDALRSSLPSSKLSPKRGGAKTFEEAWENRVVTSSIKAVPAKDTIELSGSPGKSVLPRTVVASSEGKEDDADRNGGSKAIAVVGIHTQDALGIRGLYTGAVADGTQIPDGFGQMKYNSGRGYKGEWVAGHFEGKGRLINAVGDVYEGTCMKNKREGRGLLKFADGRVFDGIFKSDRMKEGTLSFPDQSEYKGVLKNGKRNGLGVNVYADGSRYEGKWTDNVFQGKGKMTWNDGASYDGEWNKGLMHGQGIELRADGTIRHQGQFADGDPVR
jgi:hypothetical protein